jgi:hypothetical protein
MKRLAIIFLMAGFGFAESWTGRLVDAICKVSSQGTCAPTKVTHLFAIELADSTVLNLDAAGNEKADDAIKNVQTTDLHVAVTGSLDGKMVKVATLAVQPF